MTSASVKHPAVRLGLDTYSLRSQGMSPFDHLDFAARHGLQVVHFSEIRLIGGLDPRHLRAVRDHADALGLELEIGMGSICPSSATFNPARGTAEEQLGQMIDAACSVGSPIVRCFVGAVGDRVSPGGIDARIDHAVHVLGNIRSRAEDAGIRIAVENHAGDLQARELKALVEAAGPDFVGVCIDSGNPLWAIEDPHLTLETLAPYVLTSHTRDSALRRTDRGIEVAWTRMGSGNVRIGEYLRSYVARCPDRPLSLEVIVMSAPRLMAVRDPAFWDGYRHMPAWEFERFLELVDEGAEVSLPEGPVDPVGERQHVEASIRWTQGFFGLRGDQP